MIYYIFGGCHHFYHGDIPNGTRSKEHTLATQRCFALQIMQAFLGLFIYLLLPPVFGDRFFQFGACSISMNINEIRDDFGTIKKVIQARDPIRTASILHPRSLHNFQSLDSCCLARSILSFYLDRVFRHCETESLYINRKISGIANSFLSIEKKFRVCQDENMCSSEEEAINKYQQIITNYEQIHVTSAAMKALGELDILLNWLEAYQNQNAISILCNIEELRR